MSSETKLRLTAVGPASAAAAIDFPALVQASLVQLYGVIGGAVPFSFEADPDSSGSAGVLTVDKLDESKLRAALTLVASYQGKPLRIEVGAANSG